MTVNRQMFSQEGKEGGPRELQAL